MITSFYLQSKQIYYCKKLTALQIHIYCKYVILGNKNFLVLGSWGQNQEANSGAGM